jgi:glutamine amidotransferase
MSKREVVIIDYGVGNLLSVQRGLEYCGVDVVVSADAQVILNAKRVVLPGVGAFANAMAALHERGLVKVIRNVAARGTQLLGICLGMQLLLDESEEFGVTAGLGIIPGRVVPIPATNTEGASQKIPHIGWSELRPSENPNWEGSLLQGIRPNEAVYFVHSFQVNPNEPADRVADCIYGGHRIPAVIRHGQVTGCQFHPEKSGKTGLAILSNFCGN